MPILTIPLIIAANVVLILDNLSNAYIDAYKITMLKKVIRHGINFVAYAIVTAACIFFFKMPLRFAITFAFSAFFNRQITFDIPLNLRRGLRWNYVSLDRPPKSLMDRIEVRLFGYNGKVPTIGYGILWAATIIIQFSL